MAHTRVSRTCIKVLCVLQTVTEQSGDIQIKLFVLAKQINREK